MELYNDIENKDDTYFKINEEIKEMYNNEFGDTIIRREITDIEEIKRILPS